MCSDPNYFPGRFTRGQCAATLAACLPFLWFRSVVHPVFGDHRQRYPHRSILPGIAGTSPVTVASGKSHYVKFRRACNRRYRQTAPQLAQASTRQSVWAVTYFHQARDRGHSKSHAYRCLANRWLHIIWSLWQTRQPYDESYHLQQVARHRRPSAELGTVG